MKEFKGTKGPWKTTEISVGNSIYIESKEECIGTVWRGEVSDFNAKLISAAPELLEALQAIVDNIDNWLETGIPADTETSEILYKNGKKAINKALGL